MSWLLLLIIIESIQVIHKDFKPYLLSFCATAGKKISGRKYVTKKINVTQRQANLRFQRSIYMRKIEAKFWKNIAMFHDMNLYDYVASTR